MYSEIRVGCFEIRVPHTTDVRAKIQLQVKLLESNYTINGVDYVHINQNTGITFVQTDRNIYKPGDRVKIRILLLTSDLTVPKNLTVNRNNKSCVEHSSLKVIFSGAYC